MPEYEIIVESTNPCGGTKYAQREFIEAETDSPEAYVKAHGRYPVREITETATGDVVITTGNDSGYMIRYTFAE